MRSEIDRLRDDLDAIPQEYVTRREFDASVKAVKDVIEDFKEDMRRGFHDIREDIRHYIASESKSHPKRPI